MTYSQEVYRILQAGDTLTITFHTSKEEWKITADFREDERWDYVFEVSGQEPTPDMFPLIEKIYQNALQKLQVGDMWTIAFHIQRL